MYLRLSVVAIAVMLACCSLAGQQGIRLDRSLTFTSSASIQPGKYLVADAGGGVLRVQADNVVIDFKGATLRPREDVWHDLDHFEGTGLVVQGRKNVTIKNAHINGYRWNIRIVD